MTMLRLALIASLALAAPAFGQQTEVGRNARRAGEELQAQRSLISELAGMGAVDRVSRYRFLQLRKDASPAERVELDEVFRTYFAPIDKANAERLKTLLEGRAWFRVSEVGPQAEQAAGLVALHGDLGLQKAVLAKMEPLLGKETPPTYANLYDRVALDEGRLQRYGTQGTNCVGGEYATPKDVEDLDGLDARRKSVGLEPMSESLKRLKEMYGRCDQ